MDDFTDAVTLTSQQTAVGVVVVCVTGELDMATTPLLEEFVRVRLVAGTRTLTLDLSGVTFLGSTGINALITLRATCEERGTALRLVPNTKVVLRALAVTDLTGHFTLVAVDEAS
jgi:anti-sigma B factor antagonist